MSRKTRERIETAMRDLHFAPNALVRAIRHGRTGIIGVLTFGLQWMVDPHTGSMTGSLLQGISDVADPADRELLLYTGWPQRAERYSELDFLNGHIDGLIWVAPALNEPLLSRVASAGLPVVALLTRHVPPAVSYVNADNLGGLEIMVGHLLQLGHRRIAYVGPAHSSNYIDRYEAYRRALAEASIPLDPALMAVPKTNLWDMDFYHRRIESWLTMPQRPTAIVTADDGFAETTIRCLVNHDIRVPEDVSVTGFNDLPLASYLQGGLSTIRQPLIEIGRAGAECLIDLIDNRPKEPFEITIPSEVMVRHTTGPAPTGS